MATTKKTIKIDVLAKEAQKSLKLVDKSIKSLHNEYDKIISQINKATKATEKYEKQTGKVLEIQKKIAEIDKKRGDPLKGILPRNIKDYYSSKFSVGLEKAATYRDTLKSLSKVKGPAARKEEKAIQEKLTQQDKENKQLAASTLILKGFVKATSFAWKELSNFTIAVKKNIENILSLTTGVATYNIGTSLTANTTAREQQLKYGLSSAQNYAFSKAKQLLNLSEEDLPYMNAAQRKKLMDYMERYSNWYNRMERSGVLSAIQELQLQFNELKEQFAMDFLEWIAQNKDTIMSCLVGIFNVVKFIGNAVLNIINAITNPFGVSKASDSINNGISKSSTINNVNINATSNISGTATAIATREESMWSDLAKQITGAIGA